jgi:hypothetical protein
MERVVQNIYQLFLMPDCLNRDTGDYWDEWEVEVQK